MLVTATFGLPCVTIQLCASTPGISRLVISAFVTAPAPVSEIRRGIVLGAGGVLGAAWTMGALSALLDVSGVEPGTAEVVVGTSAGAVLASFVGRGMSTEQLVRHQRGIVAVGDPKVDYDYDASPALPPSPRWGTVGSPRILAAVRAASPPHTGGRHALGDAARRSWVAGADRAVGTRIERSGARVAQSAEGMGRCDRLRDRPPHGVRHEGCSAGLIVGGGDGLVRHPGLVPPDDDR